MKNKLNAFLGSTLPGGHKLWHGLVAALFILLVANTLFLLARRYGFGCSLSAFEACSVSYFYQASVLAHSLLGVLLSVAAIIFVAIHVPKNLKTAKQKKKLPVSGVLTLVTLGVLLWSGIYFLFNAKSEDTRWLYNTHLGVAAAIVFSYFAHRAMANPLQTAKVLIGASVISLVGCALLIGVEIGVAPVNEAVAQDQTLIAAKSSDAGFHPVTAVPADQPFFPSPVRLASGKQATNSQQLLAIPPTAAEADKVRREVAEQGFASSVPIGAEKCQRCHADIVEQWSSSAHRFSSFNNPFYVATLEYLRGKQVEPNEFVDRHLSAYGLPKEDTGKIKSRWCAGCHDPLLMLTGGRMLQDVDKGSIEAQAGLTCLSCHVISDIPGHTGNANYVWNDKYKDSYLFSAAAEGTSALLHDTYLKANPERHVADLNKPFFSKSEYCATCHKVALERPLNDYRWLRGQNEYDNWHASGVAHNAARTFYLPPGVRQCQDCHMPLVEAKHGDLAATDGVVRSHRFTAANTALPWLRGDSGMLAATEKFLREKKLRLFAAGAAGAEADGIVALTDGQPHEIKPVDGRIELHAVVRNLGVGHTFPSGTNDSNESWIEVTATGAGGTYRAGALDADGHVIANTRIFNAVQVNRDGQRIDKRNAHEMVAVVYAAVIPPSASDLSRYSIPLRELGDLSQGSTIKIRLLWRKFNRAYTEFAFKANRPGFAKFAETPELPISEIGAVALTVKQDGERVLIQASQPEGVEPAALLHDYAIGFLQQQDYKSAKQAIAKTLVLDPKCVNCMRTQARIQIEENQFGEARKTLTEAEKIAPADPQNAWLWAQVLMEEGNYPAAESAVDRSLAAFKEDRVALKLKGRIDYLDGRFKDALAAIGEVLRIDPEDATAHYYAMLSQRALGDTAAAGKEEDAYKYYKRDDSAQESTLAFRQTEDEANFASQNIKVFSLK